MARFSERLGAKSPKGLLPLDSTDADLRNSLWNVCFAHVLPNIQDRQARFLDFISPLAATFIRDAWEQHFKQPFDDLNPITTLAISQLRAQCFSDWAGVYDFIEFAANTAPCDQGPLVRDLNQVLERECSGYRFVNTQLTPLSRPEEIAAVQAVRDLARPFAPVQIHIKSAVDKLSDRRSPDYRNSIKESISAVEAMCQIITGDAKATLNTALKKLEGAGVTLHPALRQAFEKLYAYTGDAEGIRHALLEEPTLGFDDAKFMLVSCSGFVNYLAAKASKAEAIPEEENGGE